MSSTLNPNPSQFTTPPADGLSVTITPNAGSAPVGKLADAEITFTAQGPLQGLRLLGFAIWERRTGSGRNVTFPARQYSVNGERRSFALLRPQAGEERSTMYASNRARDLILSAYAAYEAHVDEPAAEPAAAPAAQTTDQPKLTDAL